MTLETKEEMENHTRLRRRGVILGLVGVVVFFASVIAIIPLPSSFMVYCLVTMAVGIAFLAAGYMTLRKADVQRLKE